jgi:hypothetical protein
MPLSFTRDSFTVSRAHTIADVAVISPIFIPVVKKGVSKTDKFFIAGNAAIIPTELCMMNFLLFIFL